MWGEEEKEEEKGGEGREKGRLGGVKSVRDEWGITRRTAPFSHFKG